MKDTNKTLYLLLFVLALAVNFAGINVKFFTDDPGLYASIAKNLLYKKDLFNLFTYNTDWLDKPHLPFWAALLSFKLFGISVWAYRLPALICFAISLLYTWLFTRRYYGWETAATAVLITMTALNILLSNTDVRAEPYLMAFIMGSIYHIARLEERYSLTDLLLAALLTAFAIMTKGIFVIAAIYGALLGQLLFQKKFKSIFQLKWMVLFGLTFIFILPEFYALYIQFDLHPEKTVFDTNHVSGIKWFLWDSQFGRFVNSGPINRQASGSIFFYLHTLLWAFAPWCLLFYYAIFKNIKALIRRSKLKEYYAFSGGLFLLLLFSLSGFQLPFYTNAVFPLFAVITAPFCLEQLSRAGSKFRVIALWIFAVLLFVAVIMINNLLAPVNKVFFIADCICFALLILLILIKIKEGHKKAFFICSTSALFVGFYLNTVFYKEIVSYRGQITAAAYINQKPFNKVHVYSLKAENNIFQFYCKRPVDLVPIADFGKFKPNGLAVFYASQKSLDYLLQNHIDFRVIRSFINYPQENILPKFIDKTTRNEVLDHVYLISK
ncbi:ArnT family glycosyltransferase [Mucilaginibacter sp.]|uniref:ArnT family glycosyltransferase n=1 Tax=Mucilaginibacter sp. TaxID=1882438 RepID=UPI003D1155AF